MEQQRSAWKGILAGLTIVIVGLLLFNEGSGIRQTPQTTALFSVIVALGIGLIGAALMPDSLTINGRNVKPLGLGGTATGGAAFFVATLLFLYATGANKPDAPSPAPAPTPTAPSSSATPAPTPSGAPATPVEPGPVASFTPARMAVNPPSTLPDLPGPYRAWTWCSECCVEGPEGCPNVGWGWGGGAEQAADNAIKGCIQTGGHPRACAANVQPY